MHDKKMYKILIVDDSAMNRMILADILGDRFEIIEAEDGVKAISIIKQQGNEISLVLLDLVMPNMDGLEVLAAMNQGRWIEDLPVIMVSAENSPSYIERAYELGAVDFISRPFNVSIVQKRVQNTIMLFSKQRSLVRLVNDQVFEKEKNNNLMINILSHIVEFRNGESGLHVLHINMITDILLNRLSKMSDKYKLSPSEISTIVTASSLHDIGKIAVPDEVLNKPGRLTPEEFEVIKTHSSAGEKLLSSLSEYLNEPLVVVARDICLYHHERYDGKGYPMGLVGDDIPISAQVVAVADVYDALTSERCYKKAIPHEKAIEMIVNGECGAFNPILVECLLDAADYIKSELKVNSAKHRSAREIKKITDEMLTNDMYSAANRSINILEQARIKYEFFASMSREIQYELTFSPLMLTISDWCAEKFKLPTIILNPFENEHLLEIIGGRETIDVFKEHIRKTNLSNPITQFEIKMKIDGEYRWHRVYCRVTWSQEDESKIISSIGKIIDINEDRQMLRTLEKKASTDTLTGIYNRGYSKELISSLLKMADGKKYALALIDLDDFKLANDNYGHMFGDKVLKAVADKLIAIIRANDIVARIGGDEFLFFIEYKDDLALNRAIERIFGSLNNFACDNYDIRISMGVATTDDKGFEYDSLFNAADSALYHSKRNGRGAFSFYDNTMKLETGDSTPIDG